MRVALIMPPFAAVQLPSLGLAQLKSRLLETLGARVDVEVHYLNHDLARHLGFELYHQASWSSVIYHTGFGDWLFREIAFPGLPDNTDAYLARFYRQPSAERELVTQIAARRGELGAWIDETIARLALDRADVVGLTSMFAQTVAGIAFARRIKAASPRVVTLLGGPALEAPMGPALAARLDCVDYVFSGPALVSLPELVSALLDRDEARCRRIPGVTPHHPSSLRVAGEACGDAGAELDIATPIPLDYDDFLASLERNFGDAVRPIVSFETSRGCWWGAIRHCTFCGLNGPTMESREMPAEQALAQFESLFTRYPQVKHFVAVDNILPLAYLKEVLPRLRPPPGVTIFYEVKPNMDEDDVRVLGESGVRVVQPGIEALDSSTLKRINKGVGAFQNIRFLKYCRQYGVSPDWYLIVGFPGEPESIYAKYLRDFPLLTHLAPPWGINTLRFDRYSPYFTRAAEYGLTLRPFDFYRFIFPFDDAMLGEIAFHFTNSDPAFFVPMAKWSSRLRAEVNRWKRRWSSSDGGEPPQLHLDGDRIIDTRDGRRLELPIGDAERKLLFAFDTPRAPEQVAALALEPDAARTIASFEERGLFFREGERLLNLVLPRPPAESTFDRSGPWSPS